MHLGERQAGRFFTPIARRHRIPARQSFPITMPPAADTSLNRHEETARPARRFGHPLNPSAYSCRIDIQPTDQTVEPHLAEQIMDGRSLRTWTDTPRGWHHLIKGVNEGFQ